MCPGTDPRLSVPLRSKRGEPCLQKTKNVAQEDMLTAGNELWQAQVTKSSVPEVGLTSLNLWASCLD